MAQKKIRKRRATLHGWWKVIPIVVGPLMLLMTFAYWETQRLQNQYSRSERLVKIEELRKDIGYLSDHDRELNRIAVMDEKAPSWDLREPDPDQIVVVPVEGINSTLSSIGMYREDFQVADAPTRTVLLHLSYEEIFANENHPEEPRSLEREQIAYETPAAD